MFQKTNMCWEVISVSEQIIKPDNLQRPHYNQYSGILETSENPEETHTKEWLIKKVLSIFSIGNKKIPTYFGADYRLICVNGKYKITLNNEDFAEKVSNEWRLANHYSKDLFNEIEPLIEQIISSEV